MYLFFDTETTGFPSNDKQARDPKQARVCQLAMILTDESGKTFMETSFYIKPDGWTITDGAFKVHGITAATCEKYGIDSHTAFRTFLNAVDNAQVVIGHNVEFDLKMMNIEREATGFTPLTMPKTFCTMKASTDICRIPGNYDRYKWPKLSEALPVICGREIDGAHDAMVDTMACKDIFFALSPFKVESYEEMV